MSTHNLDQIAYARYMHVLGSASLFRCFAGKQRCAVSNYVRERSHLDRLCRGGENLARKGQALFPDFVAGISLFSVLLVLSISLYISAYRNNAEVLQIEDLQRQSSDVLDTLVRSHGMPSGWTNETVTIIGLAESDHVLDSDKLLELKKVSDDKLRALFGIGQYYVHLTVENKTDVVMYEGTNLSYGTAVNASAENVLFAVRRASLTIDGNRTTVDLKLRVWK